MEYLMQYLEEQILNWKYMEWRVFLKKTLEKGEECSNRRTKVAESNVVSCYAVFWRIIMLASTLRNSKEKDKPGGF